MTRVLFFVTVFLTFQVSVFAHSLMLNIIDNEDGTMEVVGEFSTGATAQGAMLKIQTSSDLKIVYEKRMPATGSLVINIPSKPYKVILDAGQGHTIVKDGIVEPVGGFMKGTNKVSIFSSINIAFYSTLTLSLFFIFLAILFSILRFREFKLQKSAV